LKSADENHLNVNGIALSVLIVNPFSPEAERIVKKHRAEGMSKRVVAEQAKKLVGWKVEGAKKKIISENLKSGYDLETDILSQRLLFLTVALNFTPYSNELRLVKETIRDLVKARLLSSLDPGFEDATVNLLSDLFHIKVGTPTFDGGMRFGEVFVEKRELFARDQLRYGEPWSVKFAVDWRDLKRIIQGRELRFTDIYLVEGLALLSLNDLIDLYSRLIALNIEDFITARFEEFQSKRKSDEIKRLTLETEELSEHMSSVSGKSYKGSVLQGRAGRLRSDNFPPCIQGIVAGVQTGSRNYAISVLLTSFISYARIAPKKVQDPRISDYVKDPKVLTDELLPIIFEAAARCSPPLFEDQPMEKMNVHYHLGLGLSSQARLENSGNSNWYFPPNCEKIRRESPGLCKPDETCRRIKNPLTYYFVKFKKGEAEE
jgi:DNA primase large subunit